MFAIADVVLYWGEGRQIHPWLETRIYGTEEFTLYQIWQKLTLDKECPIVHNMIFEVANPFSSFWSLSGSGACQITCRYHLPPFQLLPQAIKTTEAETLDMDQYLHLSVWKLLTGNHSWDNFNHSFSHLFTFTWINSMRLAELLLSVLW